MEFTTELNEALEAARIAGEYIRREYESFTPVPNAPANISTHVDHESQEIILRHLSARFPNDGLVAEEATASLARSAAGASRTWVVDPIDGTRGFAIKNGEFSVMIGLTVDGKPVAGVVLEPTLDRYTYATLGGGCWVRIGAGEPTRCQVKAQTVLAESTLIQSRSKPGAPPKPVVVALRPKSLLETYSAGIKLAMVARGDGEMYVNDYTGFHDWDICAGHILVEEAGGRVSLFSGETIRYGGPGSAQRRGMVATNGMLHDEIVERLKSL